MDVTQGKLVIGLNIEEKTKPQNMYPYYTANMILGGGANSKLFQKCKRKSKSCTHMPDQTM